MISTGHPEPKKSHNIEWKRFGGGGTGAIEVVRRNRNGEIAMSPGKKILTESKGKSIRTAWGKLCAYWREHNLDGNLEGEERDDGSLKELCSAAWPVYRGKEEGDAG